MYEKRRYKYIYNYIYHTKPFDSIYTNHLDKLEWRDNSEKNKNIKRCAIVGTINENGRSMIKNNSLLKSSTMAFCYGFR